MQPKWHFWQYRDDRNCWAFVRAVLIEEFSVPESAIPVWGSITPKERRAMTKAYRSMRNEFTQLDKPISGAIACHFTGRTLTHVGVVAGGEVWHVGSAFGMKKEPINKFAATCRTEYWIWPPLLSLIK
jgi:hypothetical protein